MPIVGVILFTLGLILGISPALWAGVVLLVFSGTALYLKVDEQQRKP